MPNSDPDYGGFPICVTIPAKTMIAQVEFYYIEEEQWIMISRSLFRIPTSNFLSVIFTGDVSLTQRLRQCGAWQKPWQNKGHGIVREATLLHYSRVHPTWHTYYTCFRASRIQTPLLRCLQNTFICSRKNLRLPITMSLSSKTTLHRLSFLVRNFWNLTHSLLTLNLLAFNNRLARVSPADIHRWSTISTPYGAVASNDFAISPVNVAHYDVLAYAIERSGPFFDKCSSEPLPPGDYGWYWLGKCHSMTVWYVFMDLPKSRQRIFPEASSAHRDQLSTGNNAGRSQ